MGLSPSGGQQRRDNLQSGFPKSPAGILFEAGGGLSAPAIA
jgi:hypothetical protein